MAEAENDCREKLHKVAATLHIGTYTRHVFICTGEQCCAKDVGAAAWEKLKEELKQRNLSLSDGPNATYRTKAGCLRVCTEGPILVVYPEGTYYSRMTADRIPEFVEKHLIGGQPVEEWIFARNPLPA